MEVPKSLRRKIPLAKLDSECIQHWHMIELELSEKDVWRWAQAGNAFQGEIFAKSAIDHGTKTMDRNLASKIETEQEKMVPGDEYMHVELKGADGHIRPMRDFLCLRAQNIRLADLQRLFSAGGIAAIEIMSVLTLFSALYGGIYLSLWSYHFPTPVEGLLWKISTITLGSLPGYLIGASVITMIGAGVIASTQFAVAAVSLILPTLLRPQRERGSTTERPWSLLMAFEAKENDYPSLASTTALWLKQQLWRVPNAVLIALLWAILLYFLTLYILSRIFLWQSLSSV